MRKLSLVLVLGVAILHAQTPGAPVRAVSDPGVVTTRQAITPAGAQSVFVGKVQGVVFGATPDELFVLNSGSVYRLDWRGNRVLAKVDTGGTGGHQGIRYDDATQSAVITSALNRRARLQRVSGSSATAIVDNLGRFSAGSPALSSARKLAVVPLTSDDQVAIVDLASGAVKSKVSTGIAPFAAVINAAGTIAYVSNWGGRIAAKDDVTAKIGYAADAAQVVVDKRGIASTGTVARVNLETGQVTDTLSTGLHPTALLWDEPRHRLYVANGNQDSISVFATDTNRLVRTITLHPFRESVPGITPTALAISGDGGKLYVACGGINAIAVVSTAASGKIEGLIPTAWYPNSLAMSANGKYLAVATLMGPGSGFRDEPKRRYVHAVRGSVAVVEIPDAPQLAAYTSAVAENNRMNAPPEVAASATSAPRAAPHAIPARPGDPSLIEHVVYVIKENRTYDQVFGDIPEGNGDPSLVMFGEKITPNQHRLARQFVLLDNFFASGGNSADGHQWVTQATENDYVMLVGYSNRSYPFDGSDPIAIANSGFLWDAAVKARRTVRIYGEYAGTITGGGGNNRHELMAAWERGEDFTKKWNTVAPLAPINALLAKNFPAYTTAIPDVVRAQIFLADLKSWEAAGNMPNLTILQLPSNHTNGTTPGANTPSAMVADNDYALGQVVDALSHSRFWKKMAIFVVEDDAQNGVDHVDGHRTVALAISPYARRGAVDSTFYSQPSMLKTIELILGLRPLSLFDRIAYDMRAGFHDTPDLTAYDAVVPTQPLTDINPPLKALNGQARSDALASSKMRWDVPDAAPSDRLNRILWRQVRGLSTPYPQTRKSIFSPFALDVDDDDRE